MPSHFSDSGSNTLDPRETKILSDILALVLDEQQGASAAALNALKLKASRSGITGGAIKNLFIRLSAEIKPPPRPQQQIDQLTQRIKKATHETNQALQQVAVLRAALHRSQQEHQILRRTLAEKRYPFTWYKTALIIALITGTLLGIAGSEIVHALTAPVTHIQPLYFR